MASKVRFRCPKCNHAIETSKETITCGRCKTELIIDWNNKTN